MHDMAILQKKAGNIFSELSLAVPVYETGISSAALKCYETGNDILISKKKTSKLIFFAADYVQGRISDALIFAN